jgi:hypothetical protein
VLLLLQSSRHNTRACCVTNHYAVAYLVKARILGSQEPASKQQRNGVFCAVHADGYSCNKGICQVIAKQEFQCNRGTVSSMRSVPGLYNKLNFEQQSDNRCGSVVSCCCKKQVAEAGDNSVTQRKGNVRRWKSLPSNG